MRILVIEDSTDIRENLIELLELAGYQTLSAENGKAGLRAAFIELPDLILCDVMMPQMDGYQVFDAVKYNSATKHIPFIFITSSVERKDIQFALDKGADGYIKKPFDIEDLYKTVLKHVR